MTEISWRRRLTLGLQSLVGIVLKKVWAVGLIGMAGLVSAQNLAGAAAHFKLTRIEHEEIIQADHTSTQNVTMERLALSDTGAIAIGRYKASFNQDLESLEVTEAHTQKADGRKIPVAPDQILVQRGLLAEGGATSWPGLNTLQITFPQVQSGDKTLVQLRRRVHRTPLPNWLTHFDFLPNNLTVDFYKVTLTAPIDMPMEVMAQGFKKETNTEAGRNTWTLTGHGVASSSEPMTANSLKIWPYWAYSTLPSRSALSDAFAQAMRGKMIITPEIQSLSEQITQGARGDLEKAGAISRWIAKEMRYVAIFVGAGGYVANNLPDILKNRYGDCKDHVLLMMSLLQAAGIESAPVLINTANSDWVPPAAIATYDHALVFIPHLNLFTDPTAKDIPFGSLSWSVSAKPVLVGLTGGSQDMRTPAFEAQHNRIEIQSTWLIKPDGHAHAELQIGTVGEAATTLQNRLIQIPAGFSGTAVQRLLSSSGLKGKGFMQYPAVQRTKQAQSLSAQMELPDFLPHRELVTVNVHPAINSIPVYILSNLGPQNLEARQSDMLCTPIQIRERFELALPPKAELLLAPAETDLQDAGLTYRSRYRVEGTKIIGDRFFERLPTRSGHICTTDEVTQRRAVLDAIRKDLRQVVSFKQR